MGPDHAGHNMSSHAGHDMPSHAGQDMSSHAGQDMSSHAGHDMSSHAGHDMSSHAQMTPDGGAHDQHSAFVYMSGGHGDGVLQAGVQEVLLFSGASTSSVGSLAFACLVLVILTVLLEYLRLLAWWLESRHVKCSGGRRDDNDDMTTCSGKKAEGNHSQTSSWLSLCLLSVLHVIIYVSATCLMLITMTFNIYLIVAIAIGVSAGKIATMFTKARLTTKK